MCVIIAPYVFDCSVLEAPLHVPVEIDFPRDDMKRLENDMGCLPCFRHHCFVISRCSFLILLLLCDNEGCLNTLYQQLCDQELLLKSPSRGRNMMVVYLNVVGVSGCVVHAASGPRRISTRLRPKSGMPSSASRTVPMPVSLGLRLSDIWLEASQPNLDILIDVDLSRWLCLVVCFCLEVL